MTPFIVAIALVVVVSLALRANLLSVTVFEYERGLRFERGRFVRVVDPGKYWLWAPVVTLRRVDVRSRVVAIAGQEVLSADGVALKVSVSAVYRIIDPKRALLELEDHQAALYSLLQLSLRAIIAGSTVEHLLERRATIGKELLERTIAAAANLGLELSAADLKDLTLPGDLKKIFAQVVRARQEGLAALERARGETAALRNLANAARLVEGSPHLLQLRWLQVLGERSGNTVVLGVPSGPVPIQSAQAGGQLIGGAETEGSE